MSNLVFMGTPQIAADVLQALLDDGQKIALVVCQPDKKVGRKGVLTPCAVKKLALAHDIPVFQPVRLREDYAPILEVSPDLIITCAYGQIVPQAVLDAPVHGCVNLHGSLLPAYRGAAPIQRAIMDGVKESGMTLMKMEAGLDTGPYADVEKIVLDENETTTTLFERMGKAAGRLIVRDLPLLLEDKLEFVAQDDALATHAAKISKEEEHLDLTMPDDRLLAAIRGLAEEPGGYIEVDGKKIKLLGVRYVAGSTPGAGVLAKEGKKTLLLGGHDGAFVLDRIQPEGKKIISGADFVNGAGRSLIGRKAG